MIDTFFQQIVHAAPLFILVLMGYALMRIGRWPPALSDAFTRFVFGVAMPALLFHLMSDFSKLPRVDARLLIAFFGGCVVTFVLARLLSWRLFGLNGVEQSVFALGGIFSNNVLLGIPIAKLAFGDEALPVAALVIAFNALTLWSMVTVSVELARNESMSLKAFGKTAWNIVRNPLIGAILLGTAFGFTGLKLPVLIEKPLVLVADSAMPLSLIALGMGLAEYGIKRGWEKSLGITFVKLVLQPLVVWSIAWLIDLPRMETRVIVMLASLSTGVNVYLMARQFKAIEAPVASALVLTTLLASITVPFGLALTDQIP